MSYTALDSIQWGGTPKIGVSFGYDSRRAGGDMQYRIYVTVAPLTGASYFGYPIYLTVYVDGDCVDSGYTLKQASPSRWSGSIEYDSGWVTAAGAVGSAPLSIRLYSGSGSTRDDSYGYALPVERVESIGDFTLTAGDAVIGQAGTLTVTRPGYGYSFAFRYALGSAGGSIAAGDLKTVNSSSGRVVYQWTVPEALAQQLPESAAPCGLVHARFATCGGCTAENVHPFVTDDYCLAMNGTVENAVALRSALNLLPYPDSDGAVLAALLQAYADSGTVAALRLCCREARGNYALAVLRRGEECLFACAHGAPLYAAVGGGSACVSSDLAALEPDQMKIYALSAGECVQLRPGKLQFWNAKGKKIKKSPCAVTLRRPPAAGFADPGEALQALPGDLELLLHRFVRGDQPRLGKSRLRPRGISRVLLVGCGTSYQLAQAAACNFESVCDVPAFAYSAGEFCAGGVVCDRGALVVGISASGQTAEVAEALQKAAAFGARTASLTGDPDSPLARAGGTLLSLPCSLPGGLPPVTHFVLGYVLLALVAVDWGLRQKTITPLFGRMAVKLCATLPDKLRLILKSGSELDALAAYLTGYDRLLFVGQNIDLAAAGAMAGVWSRTLGVSVETVPAAELRHTLLPTVDSHTALVALISSRELTEKTCAALQLAAIRGAGTVACTVESLAGQLSGARQVFLFPDSLPLLAPVCQCATLSMLLLRLCTAREQAGRPVEQPPVLPRYFAG